MGGKKERNPVPLTCRVFRGDEALSFRLWLDRVGLSGTIPWLDDDT